MTLAGDSMDSGDLQYTTWVVSNRLLQAAFRYITKHCLVHLITQLYEYTSHHQLFVVGPTPANKAWVVNFYTQSRIRSSDEPNNDKSQYSAAMASNNRKFGNPHYLLTALFSAVNVIRDCNCIREPICYVFIQQKKIYMDPGMLYRGWLQELARPRSAHTHQSRKCCAIKRHPSPTV